MEFLKDFLNDFLAIAIKALAIFVAVYLIPKIKTWISSKISNEQLDTVKGYIKDFVESAEQQYKNVEKSGAQKNQYVKDQLSKLGIELTDEVCDFIEAAVLELTKSETK